MDTQPEPVKTECIRFDGRFFAIRREGFQGKP